jgi:D-beta-D-heptose 7-phosphate kinase/D-beta-D-heptose 1-phosphate adenosyltransferase
MRPGNLGKILNNFPRQKILVVGDVMLDIFVWGRVSRISPEAPVPVVEVTNESYFPGGAANVARNLRALDGQTNVLGLIGADLAGRQLRDTLADGGVGTTGLVVDKSRPTTVKTRVVAHHQQVVRFDKESSGPVSPALAKQMLAKFTAAVAKVDAVIFEDYAKGVLTPALLNQMLTIAQHRGKITAADPNPRRILDCRGLTAITPNRHEAFAAAGIRETPAQDDVLNDRPLLEVGEKLLAKWQPVNLLITLGEHGMCLFRQGQRPHHIPTVAQEVFDVSGAGDTAIATLVLALAAGADAVCAAEIANHAAGIVVGKIGTATCTRAELRASFQRNHRR